jgi:hypothetical protein
LGLFFLQLRKLEAIMTYILVALLGFAAGWTLAVLRCGRSDHPDGLPLDPKHGPYGPRGKA